MKDSPLHIKSKKFADRIFKLHKYLCEEKKEFTTSKQILRSGTSIGANISESRFASSKKDFLLKITIAAKEYSETIYWLERLRNSGHITEKQFESIHKDCSELGAMLTSTIKTTKHNLKNNTES